MSNYDELLGVDMTRDANLPVPSPVQKQVATEHRVRGKISIPSHETQLESQMTNLVPHAKNPESHMLRDNVPTIDSDYSMEKEV